MLAVRRRQLKAKQCQVMDAIRRNATDKDHYAQREERARTLGEVFRQSSQLLDMWNGIGAPQETRGSFEKTFREKLTVCADMGMRAVHIWWRWKEPMPDINPHGTYFQLYVHPNPAVRKSLEKRRKMVLRVFYRNQVPIDVSAKIMHEYLY